MMSPSPEGRSSATTPPEYSPEERAVLLSAAHEAIASLLQGREIPLEAPSNHLAEPRGAFTTLYSRGELRGCVGFVLPVVSVYRTVIETARGAAFEDSRFVPVSREELPGLEISLSILSVPQPVRPEEIVIGRHGLIISQGGHRGLLLPQVAGEHGWDCNTFLEQTCRKAGLPLDAWKKGATVEAFTAEVFGDDGLETGARV